jgi:hypothetical protein
MACLRDFAYRHQPDPGRWAIKDAPGLLRYVIQAHPTGSDAHQAVLQLADDLERGATMVAHSVWLQASNEVHQLRAENERLKEENDSLKADAEIGRAYRKLTVVLADGR